MVRKDGRASNSQVGKQENAAANHRSAQNQFENAKHPKNNSSINSETTFEKTPDICSLAS